MKIAVQKLTPQAQLPYYATPESAGGDLCACIEKNIVIQPGECTPIGTGIAMEIPSGFAGFIYGRSGLGVKHGIIPGNCVGVIDSDYRGEIIVGLRNTSSQPFTIEPGQRIAQIVLSPISTAEFIVCENLSDTQRGTGGFGSTGLQMG